MHIYLCDRDDVKNSDQAIFRFCMEYADDLGMDAITGEAILLAKIIRTPRGKPFLQGIPCIHFSVSHSKTIWGCAIDSHPIGFDIEDFPRFNRNGDTDAENKKDGKWIKLSGRFFTEAEQDYVLSGGERAFLKLWVKKEAYLKYKGSGLSDGLAGVELIKDGQPVCQLPDGWVDEIKIDNKLVAAYSGEHKRQTKKIFDYRQAKVGFK